MPSILSPFFLLRPPEGVHGAMPVMVAHNRRTRDTPHDGSFPHVVSSMRDVKYLTDEEWLEYKRHSLRLPLRSEGHEHIATALAEGDITGQQAIQMYFAYMNDDGRAASQHIRSLNGELVG